MESARKVIGLLYINSFLYYKKCTKILICIQIDPIRAVVYWLACSAQVLYILCLSLGAVKSKTIKLIFAASLLSTVQELEQRLIVQNQDNMSEWSNMSTCRLYFRIRIMCQNGAICLPTDCISESG